MGTDRDAEAPIRQRESLDTITRLVLPGINNYGDLVE